MMEGILYLVLYTLHVEFWSPLMGAMDTRNEAISYAPPVMDAPISDDGSKLITAGTVYINELAWNEHYRMKESMRNVTLKEYRVFRINTKTLTIEPYTVKPVNP